MSKWRVVKDGSGKVLACGWSTFNLADYPGATVVVEHDSPVEADVAALKSRVESEQAANKTARDAAIAKIKTAAGLTDDEAKLLWPSA